MNRAVIAVCVLLCACGKPPPRDSTWFEAHPDEAAKVVDSCESGERSNECENARTAIARLKSKARMELYRKGFQ